MEDTGGAKNLESLVSKSLSPFQICVALAHKGDIRTSYAVPQVALNSRGSLDIGWAMADRRKRGAPSGSVPSSRPRQRSRPSSDREGMLQRMEAAAVLVLVLSTVVTSVVVHCFLPKPRQVIHKPRRLDWEEHTADISRRGLFRRMHRMDEHTFNKLAEMLRPILKRSKYYASEKREKCGEKERESRSHGEFCVCVRKPNAPAWFSHRFLWYSSTT